MDLLYICTTRFEKDNRTPISGMQFCTMLRREGVDSGIVDFDYLFSSQQLTLSNVLKYDLEMMIDYLLEKRPKIVCFDGNCKHYPFTVLLAKALKMRHKNVKIIFSGPQAVLTARETLALYPFIDLILMDMNESSSLKIIQALLANEKSFGQFSNVAYRERSRVVINQSDNMIEAVDLLQSINYDLMDKQYYRDAIEIEVGRGCHYDCSFCSSRLYWQKKHWLRSSAAIVAEIQHLYEKYSIKHYIIKHDLFTFDKSRVKVFCQLLMELNLPITWECTTRIDALDEAVVKLMAQAGCSKMQMGIETGSENIQKIIDKRIQLTDVLEMITMLKKNAIEVTLFFMYGFSEETVDDLGESFALISKILEQNLAQVKLYKMAVLPKTEEYDKLYHKLYFDYERPPSTVNGIKYNHDMAPIIRENKAIYSIFYEFDNVIRREYAFLDIYVDIMGYAMELYPETTVLLLNTYQRDWLALYKEVFSVLNDMVHELYLERFYYQSNRETIFKRNFTRIVDTVAKRQANGQLIRTLFDAEK